MKAFGILLSILLAMPILHGEPEAGGRVLIDFESGNAQKSFILDNAHCSVVEDGALSGKASLKIDTLKSPATWTTCFRTQPGVIKPETDYVVSFKCKPLASAKSDGFVYFVIHPFGFEDSNSDLRKLPLADVGIEKSMRLRFRTPADPGSYCLQITTKYGMQALVDDIEIREGTDELFIPARQERPLQGSLEDPKGSPEFAVALPAPAKPLEVSVSDFGASVESQDNVGAFNKAIAHCASVKASRLSVPKGVYRFSSSPSVRFEGLSDFEFDGQGSSFVFLKEKGSLFEINACARALFKDFSIDWDWEKDPIASVVKLESLGPGGQYADFRFTGYESFPKRNVRVAIVEELDPETMSVGCEGGISASFEFHKGKDAAPKTEWLSGSLLRVHLEGEARSRFAGKEGALFRMRHYSYEMNGFLMRDNEDLTLSKVSLYSCPGTGILCSGEQLRWQLLNVAIVRPPGKDRPITSAADHLNVMQSKGFLKLESCEFSFGGDDCVNIHDGSVFGVKAGAHTLQIRNLRYPRSYHEGDAIELRNDDFSPSGCVSRLKAIKAAAAPGASPEFVFEDELPSPSGAGFVLFNRRYGSGNVIIRNSSFHDNQARGLLLSGDAITVEDNLFRHNEKSAVMLQTGYTTNSWCEGYGASNIVIRGNVFENVNPRGSYASDKAPAIYFNVYLNRDPSLEKTAYPILKDILIEGNKFLNSPGAAAYVCSARNVKFRGNLIVNDRPRKERLPYRGAIAIEYSSDVEASGNVWKASPYMRSPGLIVDPLTARNIGCSGNKLLEDAKP